MYEHKVIVPRNEVVLVIDGEIQYAELKDGEILVDLGDFNNFIKPFYDGEKWTESASQEVLDQIEAEKNKPTDQWHLEDQNDNMDLIDARILKKVTGISIPTTGWVANAGDYTLKVDVPIAGILATDYVLFDVVDDSIDIAQAASLCPNCDEYAGGLTFKCKTIPTVAIPIKYTRLR